MALVWTPERISRLSLDEVKQLAANASAKGNEEVSALCQAEIQARKPKPKASAKLPEGFQRVERSALAKSLEHEAVDRMEQVARGLTEKYDLSAEKARALSPGVKGFIPHKLTSSNGSAKVGGSQKSGRVVFDRYISYRLGNQIHALVALLVNGDEAGRVQYLVVGPRGILTEAQPTSELRPDIPQGAKVGLADFAEQFDNFDAAAERFMFLMEQVAPRRQAA